MESISKDMGQKTKKIEAIRALAEETEEMASHIAERVEAELSEVTTNAPPAKDEANIRYSGEGWPPMLDDLRCTFHKIQKSLFSISNTLDKLEI